MRKSLLVVVTFAALAVASIPVWAGEEPVDILGPILDFFEAPENQAFVAQFTKDPVPGLSTVMDPMGDFYHSTGQTPGFTPDYIDITDAWAANFMPGPVDLFTPTDQNQIWAPTGPLQLEPPGVPPFYTFTGDVPQDGAQFDGGAYLFGFTLAGMPPIDVKGRCEYVVWVNDLSRGDTWENDPNFPLDPAGGTNLAFGLGINPEGQGLASTFTLAISKNGFFEPDFDVDVRAIVIDDYVGLFVPGSAIGELAGVNFYTFCVEEGFSYEPEDTGADQTGLIELTDTDLGILELAAVSTAPSTTTTSQAPTTTQAPAAGEPTVPTGETEEPGGFPWVLVLGGGLILALVGYWVYNRETDPCRELLLAWKAAQKTCDEAQAAADAARKAADDAADACEEVELDLEDLREERKDACKAWPPACWSTEEGSWVEDAAGNRITSRDLHMKKMALGEVWDDYQAGKLTAQQVEAKWREMDTPEFREEMRETDEAFKELVADIDADIAEAEEAAEEACEKATEAQQKADEAQRKADEACAAAEKAKKAYEDCIQAAVADAAKAGEGGTEGGASGPSGPGGPAVAGGGEEEPSDPCEGVEPKRRYRRAEGRADTIRVNVDFSIITGRHEGSERRVEAGEQLVTNLSDLARDLDFAGDMLNARSAGLHIGSAAQGFRQGKYVATGAGVIRGGINATMATTDLLPDVPTTPVQAGTELLEKTAQLGAFLARKVTEWMANYQIFTVRKSMFYQTITATPYLIEECRKGQGWVCVEKVWEFDVSKLKVLRGRDRWFTVNSSVRRRQFEREVRRLGQTAINTIQRDTQRLAEWRAQHEPGPC